MLYGYVDGRIISAQADGSDPDHLPDLIPVTASVIFYPITQTIVEPGTVPAEVWAKPIPATFGADGLLRDAQGNRGVWLVQGQHVVEVKGRRPDDVYPIEVTSAHTFASPLYLANARPLKPSPAEVFVVNEQILDEVREARDRAEAAALAAGAVIGGPGGDRYRYQFTEAASSWTIHHGLGRLPADVVLYPDGSEGQRAFADLTSTDQDTYVTWPEPTSGFAVIEP